jgi:hypothetical protein
MKRILAAIRPLVPVVLRDIAGFGGAGLIAVGIGAIYSPAGIIAAGTLLLLGALLSARRG